MSSLGSDLFIVPCHSLVLNSEHIVTLLLLSSWIYWCASAMILGFLLTLRIFYLKKLVAFFKNKNSRMHGTSYRHKYLDKGVNTEESQLFDRKVWWWKWQTSRRKEKERDCRYSCLMFHIQTNANTTESISKYVPVYFYNLDLVKSGLR